MHQQPLNINGYDKRSKKNKRLHFAFRSDNYLRWVFFALSFKRTTGTFAINGLQKSMFRAGHAHAGVLVILALVVQLFADHASLSNGWKRIARLSFPISAITISLGFFAAAIGRQITEPTRLIFILYVGIVILTFGLLTLGIGLIRQKKGSP